MSVTTTVFPSGRLINLLQPDPTSIDIKDIAHTLGGINRFNGAPRQHYSVAQHSVLVSMLCEPADAMKGLLHDAEEAYFGDVSSTLKKSPLMAAYRAAAENMRAVIFQVYGLTPEIPDSVHTADALMQNAEARAVLPVVPAWVEGLPVPVMRKPIEPWSRDRAQAAFLHRFEQLGGQL